MTSESKINIDKINKIEVFVNEKLRNDLKYVTNLNISII